MKKNWQLFGQIVFWLSWPLLWLYLRQSAQRTRVLVICKDQVLVVRNWHSAGRWSLPGGGLHHGEEPKVGAVREAREETGLKIEPSQLTLLNQGQFTDRGLRYNFICFYTTVDQIASVRGRFFEITDTAWLPIPQLNSKNTAKDTLMFLDAWQRR